MNAETQGRIAVAVAEEIERRGLDADISVAQGGALVLGHELSAACGHHEAEGRGGSPEQTAVRRSLQAALQRAADRLDRALEVNAYHDDWAEWQVDHVEPA